MKTRHEAGPKKSKNVLEALSPDEALAVLREMTASSVSIRKKAEQIAIKLVAAVDSEDVADDVFCALDSIAVEEVWDKSGRKRDGYVDPGDCAWQLFADALEPFSRQFQKCRDLSLDEQAKSYCMGILEGIHRFESESTSEYKSWAVDAPGEFFVSVYKQWKKGTRRKKDVADVRRFVASLRPCWAKLCN